MAPRIVLLLGSYDAETKKILNTVKNAFAKEFAAQDIYFFLVTDIEIFSDKEYNVIVENYDFPSSSIFIFDKNANLLDVEDIQLNDPFNLELDTYKFLAEWCTKNGRDLPESIQAYSFFNSLENIFRFAKIVFLIRHREETRGGEYIDLTFGAQKYGSKFIFISKEGIELSRTAVELLARYSIDNLLYVDLDDLMSKVGEHVKRQCT